MIGEPSITAHGGRELMSDANGSVKQKILAVALDHFARNGYDGASTREISEEVGLVCSAIYHYFSSKEETLHTIIHSAISQMADGLRALMDEMQDSRPAEKLGAALIYTTKVLISQQGIRQLEDAEVRSLTDKHRRECTALKRDYEAVFRNIVQEGIERGEWAPIDIPLYTSSILTLAKCPTIQS
jgi:AcrR family transcriptional regulator